MSRTALFQSLLAVFLFAVSPTLADRPPTGTVPEGSYLKSCRSARMDGYRLLATCRAANGAWLESSLDQANGCVGDVGNINGTLACTGAVGSFFRSCVDIRVEGNTLFARCERGDRSLKTTQLPGFQGFDGNINNCNGDLRNGECDGAAGRPQLDLESTPGVDPTASPAGTVFIITTAWVQGDGLCFQGDTPQSQDPRSGARMGRCNGGSNQHWRLKPAGNGYFHLQSDAAREDDRCLEGNGADSSNSLRGAAFMERCANVTGQLWSLTQPQGGYFHLQAAGFKQDGSCLEGNRPVSGVGFEGSAFRSPCGNFSGQTWKFIKLGR